MAFDPLQPYGPLVETTVRVATWNVWSDFGPWQDRYRRIESVLVDCEPDLVAAQECWRTDDHDVLGDVAARMSFHYDAALDWYEPFKLHSGSAILSRWPITRRHHVRLAAVDGGDGALLHFAEVAGPRGPLDFFAVMLDWRPDLSHVRRQQVRTLVEYIDEQGERGRPTIVCGDFNAAPDSDEVRSLTGSATALAPWSYFYDAWALAGDGTPGYTWSNRNRWAATGLLPDRRIDYVLSAWPRAGGVGHPMTARIIGDQDGENGPPSDHYGVVADLRY